jgi:hypothetical protein
MPRKRKSLAKKRAYGIKGKGTVSKKPKTYYEDNASEEQGLGQETKG